MKKPKREYEKSIFVTFDERRDTTPAGTEPDKVRKPEGAANAPGEPSETGNDLDAIVLDAWQRSILFCDVLRQRADNMIAHQRAGMPPLLDFEYEILLDARRFERPANYALLRIAKIGDDCWADCVDESKAPVIVVDPRAGHGPGIGGFKRDSEVGMAMHEGHPVYFVIFFPEPEPGQTLADVHFALRRFRAAKPPKPARTSRPEAGSGTGDGVGSLVTRSWLPSLYK